MVQGFIILALQIFRANTGSNCSYCILVFWLGLTLRLLGMQKWVKALLISSFLIFIIFGSSVATSWYQEAKSMAGIQVARKK